MKKNFFLFAVLAFLGTFFACKKSTETNPTPQLSTNYWCYTLDGVTSPRYEIADPVAFDTTTTDPRTMVIGDTSTLFILANYTNPFVPNTVPAGQQLQFVIVQINRAVTNNTSLSNLIDSLKAESSEKMATIPFGENGTSDKPVNFEAFYAIGTFDAEGTFTPTVLGPLNGTGVTGTLTLDNLPNATFEFNANVTSGDTTLNLGYVGDFASPNNGLGNNSYHNLANIIGHHAQLRK